MYKIKIILADPDSQYVEKVADFMSSAFMSRIKVVTYTKINLLQEYLGSLTEKVDILLIHPEFLPHCTSYLHNVELMMILSDGNINHRFEEYKSINKYQPGDKLVNQLLNSYAEKNANVAKLVTGSSQTKLVSVYSPAGGVGKTSVVLGLATKLSELGLEVFCLSLESINSLASALPCSGNDALTHILLSLNENADILPVKVEMYKSRDKSRCFEFFEPPDCFLELGELKQETIHDLLERMRQIGRYDVILIDMDTMLDDKAISIFTSSDKIILVQVPDNVCGYKTKNFLSQIRRTGLADKLGLAQKMIPVLNKYNGGSISQLLNSGLNSKYRIPFCPNLWSYQEGKCCFDAGRGFSSYLGGLAKFFI